MAMRSMYLATYGRSALQRAHFSIFIPNADCDRDTLPQDFKSTSAKGSIIHVVGEPVMAGYVHEFKRNYDCIDHLQDLQKLVFLGHVDTENIYSPASSSYVEESTPRSLLERLATSVKPPPRGQDPRAPVDGVTTKRCQQWTREYLTLLVNKELIDAQAVETLGKHQDSPTHGVFGYKKAV